MTATGGGEEASRPPASEPSGPSIAPADPLRPSIGRLGVIVPIALVVVGAASYLQEPMNIYDGGLLMTLATFTSPDHLPYRDLWTLYGPGPPVLASIVTHVFGAGILQVRLLLVLVHAALAAGVFTLARRYVAWGWAVILAAAISTFAFAQGAFHFAQSLTLMMWGLWFVLRAGDDPDRAPRRATVGALLLGLSFWGRFELVVVAVALVLGMWWYVRPVADGRVRRRILVAGLTPPALFLVYVVGVVGWERASLNLVDYPFRLYPQAFCRGGIEVLGLSWRALIVPFSGRWWTGEELNLAVGTFVVPILGLLVLVPAVWRWRRQRGYHGFAVLAIAFLTLVVWLQHRPRAGFAPHPTWPLAMVCLAILLGSLHRRRPRLMFGLSVGVAAIIGITIVGSWLPNVAGAWTRWPGYHPRYGFARGEVTNLFDARVWDDVTRTAQAYAAPDDPIFVALTPVNTGHFANAPLFYWVVDRVPASRFIEFNPCLTDTAEVQRMIVDDLRETNVVISTAYFPQAPPPLGPPATQLDEYLTANFDPVYQGDLLMPGDIVVLVREGTPVVAGSSP